MNRYLYDMPLIAWILILALLIGYISIYLEENT